MNNQTLYIYFKNNFAFLNLKGGKFVILELLFLKMCLLTFNNKEYINSGILQNSLTYFDHIIIDICIIFFLASENISS